MATERRIAIVGVGVVGQDAIGVDALRARLRTGEPGARPVSRFDTTDFRSHTAALVDDFEPKQFISPAKMRRMNQLSRFAVASAKLALEDAGLPENVPHADRGGVAIGTMFGPVQTSVKYLDEYREKGPSLAPPQLFAESVANAPGSHVAIQYGMKGFNLTFTQRESSAMTAFTTGAMLIAKGAAPTALVGGIDEINEITYGVYDRLGALSRSRQGLPEMARPFDRHRNGIILGEGGSMFVLIDDPGELPVYGWVAGFAQGRDDTAGLSDWGSGAEEVARVMRRAIDDAGITPDRIDAIFASANGNRKCDALEGSAIAALFGAATPPVVATKGLFGEYAAGGGLQIASALLALRHGEIYRSAGFEQSDDGVDLPVSTSTCEAKLEHVLVSSLSAGGGVVCTVLGREGAPA